MQNETQKFLQLAVSAKEASLMLTENEKEIETLEREVLNFGFKKSQNVREIFNAIKNGEKTYFILKNKLGNNIYNILVQYPTGQINANDGQNNLVANPNYQTSAILILMTKDDLVEIEKGEKSLLKIVGLTWKKI